MKRFGILSAILVTGAAQAADGLKVGGHVDAQYNWAKGGTNTFAIHEGSLMLQKTLGMGEAVLDLAVGSNGVSGLYVGTGPASQAYVSWKYENGFSWKLGQWHSIYGYESVHSTDIRFSGHGLLYDAVPVSHVGLYAGYDFSDMLGLGLVVANPADAAVMTAGNPDFGAKISTKMDTLKASVGALFSRDAATNAKSFLLDVVAGTAMDKLSVDVNFVFAKVTGGSSAFGIGGILGYGLTDVIDAGARAEYTKDLGTVGKVFALTVGPQFKMSSDFTLKADYTLNKPTGGTAGHAIAVAAVHKF
jgi:hypothetical protein